MNNNNNNNGINIFSSTSTSSSWRNRVVVGVSALSITTCPTSAVTGTIATDLTFDGTFLNCDLVIDNVQTTSGAAIIFNTGAGFNSITIRRVTCTSPTSGICILFQNTITGPTSVVIQDVALRNAVFTSGVTLIATVKFNDGLTMASNWPSNSFLMQSISMDTVACGTGACQIEVVLMSGIVNLAHNTTFDGIHLTNVGRSLGGSNMNIVCLDLYGWTNAQIGQQYFTARDLTISGVANVASSTYAKIWVSALLVSTSIAGGNGDVNPRSDTLSVTNVKIANVTAGGQSTGDVSILAIRLANPVTSIRGFYFVTFSNIQIVDAKVSPVGGEGYVDCIYLAGAVDKTEPLAGPVADASKFTISNVGIRRTTGLILNNGAQINITAVYFGLTVLNFNQVEISSVVVSDIAIDTTAAVGYPVATLVGVYSVGKIVGPGLNASGAFRVANSLVTNVKIKSSSWVKIYMMFLEDTLSQFRAVEISNLTLSNFVTVSKGNAVNTVSTVIRGVRWNGATAASGFAQSSYFNIFNGGVTIKNISASAQDGPGVIVGVQCSSCVEGFKSTLISEVYLVAPISFSLPVSASTYYATTIAAVHFIADVKTDTATMLNPAVQISNVGFLQNPSPSSTDSENSFTITGFAVTFAPVFSLFSITGFGSLVIENVFITPTHAIITSSANDKNFSAVVAGVFWPQSINSGSGNTGSSITIRNVIQRAFPGYAYNNNNNSRPLYEYGFSLRMGTVYSSSPLSFRLRVVGVSLRGSTSVNQLQITNVFMEGPYRNIVLTNQESTASGIEGVTFDNSDSISASDVAITGTSSATSSFSVTNILISNILRLDLDRSLVLAGVRFDQKIVVSAFTSTVFDNITVSNVWKGTLTKAVTTWYSTKSTLTIRGFHNVWPTTFFTGTGDNLVSFNYPKETTSKFVVSNVFLKNLTFGCLAAWDTSNDIDIYAVTSASPMAQFNNVVFDNIAVESVNVARNGNALNGVFLAGLSIAGPATAPAATNGVADSGIVFSNIRVARSHAVGLNRSSCIALTLMCASGISGFPTFTIRSVLISNVNVSHVAGYDPRYLVGVWFAGSTPVYSPAFSLTALPPFDETILASNPNYLRFTVSNITITSSFATNYRTMDAFGANLIAFWTQTGSAISDFYNGFFVDSLTIIDSQIVASDSDSASTNNAVVAGMYRDGATFAPTIYAPTSFTAAPPTPTSNPPLRQFTVTNILIKNITVITFQFASVNFAAVYHQQIFQNFDYALHQNIVVQGLYFTSTGSVDISAVTHQIRLILFTNGQSYDGSTKGTISNTAATNDVLPLLASPFAAQFIINNIYIKDDFIVTIDNGHVNVDLVYLLSSIAETSNLENWDLISITNIGIYQESSSQSQSTFRMGLDNADTVKPWKFRISGLYAEKGFNGTSSSTSKLLVENISIDVRGFNTNSDNNNIRNQIDGQDSDGPSGVRCDLTEKTATVKHVCSFANFSTIEMTNITVKNVNMKPVSDKSSVTIGALTFAAKGVDTSQYPSAVSSLQIRKVSVQNTIIQCSASLEISSVKISHATSSFDIITIDDVKIETLREGVSTPENRASFFPVYIAGSLAGSAKNNNASRSKLVVTNVLLRNIVFPSTTTADALGTSLAAVYIDEEISNFLNVTMNSIAVYNIPAAGSAHRVLLSGIHVVGDARTVGSSIVAAANPAASSANSILSFTNVTLFDIVAATVATTKSVGDCFAYGVNVNAMIGFRNVQIRDITVLAFSGNAQIRSFSTSSGGKTELSAVRILGRGVSGTGAATTPSTRTLLTISNLQLFGYYNSYDHSASNLDASIYNYPISFSPVRINHLFIRVLLFDGATGGGTGGISGMDAIVIDKLALGPPSTSVLSISVVYTGVAVVDVVSLNSDKQIVGTSSSFSTFAASNLGIYAEMLKLIGTTDSGTTAALSAFRFVSASSASTASVKMFYSFQITNVMLLSNYSKFFDTISTRLVDLDPPIVKIDTEQQNTQRLDSATVVGVVFGDAALGDDIVIDGFVNITNFVVKNIFVLPSTPPTSTDDDSYLNVRAALVYVNGVSTLWAFVRVDNLLVDSVSLNVKTVQSESNCRVRAVGFFGTASSSLIMSPRLSSSSSFVISNIAQMNTVRQRSTDSFTDAHIVTIHDVLNYQKFSVFNIIGSNLRGVETSASTSPAPTTMVGVIAPGNVRVEDPWAVSFGSSAVLEFSVKNVTLVNVELISPSYFLVVAVVDFQNFVVSSGVFGYDTVAFDGLTLINASLISADCDQFAVYSTGIQVDPSATSYNLVVGSVDANRSDATRGRPSQPKMPSLLRRRAASFTNFRQDAVVATCTSNFVEVTGVRVDSSIAGYDDVIFSNFTLNKITTTSSSGNRNSIRGVAFDGQLTLSIPQTQRTFSVKTATASSPSSTPILSITSPSLLLDPAPSLLVSNFSITNLQIGTSAVSIPKTNDTAGVLAAATVLVTAFHDQVAPFNLERADIGISFTSSQQSQQQLPSAQQIEAFVSQYTHYTVSFFNLSIARVASLSSGATSNGITLPVVICPVIFDLPLNSSRSKYSSITGDATSATDNPSAFNNYLRFEDQLTVAKSSISDVNITSASSTTMSIVITRGNVFSGKGTTITMGTVSMTENSISKVDLTTFPAFFGKSTSVSVLNTRISFGVKNLKLESNSIDDVNQHDFVSSIPTTTMAPAPGSSPPPSQAVVSFKATILNVQPESTTCDASTPSRPSAILEKNKVYVDANALIGAGNNNKNKTLEFSIVNFESSALICGSWGLRRNELFVSPITTSKTAILAYTKSFSFLFVASANTFAATNADLAIENNKFFSDEFSLFRPSAISPPSVSWVAGTTTSSPRQQPQILQNSKWNILCNAWTGRVNKFFEISYNYGSLIATNPDLMTFFCVTNTTSISISSIPTQSNSRSDVTSSRSLMPTESKMTSTNTQPRTKSRTIVPPRPVMVANAVPEVAKALGMFMSALAGSTGAMNARKVMAISSVADCGKDDVPDDDLPAPEPDASPLQIRLGNKKFSAFSGQIVGVPVLMLLWFFVMASIALVRCYIEKCSWQRGFRKVGIPGTLSVPGLTLMPVAINSAGSMIQRKLYPLPDSDPANEDTKLDTVMIVLALIIGTCPLFFFIHIAWYVRKNEIWQSDYDELIKKHNHGKNLNIIEKDGPKKIAVVDNNNKKGKKEKKKKNRENEKDATPSTDDLVAKLLKQYDKGERSEVENEDDRYFATSGEDEPAWKYWFDWFTEPMYFYKRTKYSEKMGPAFDMVKNPWYLPLAYAVVIAAEFSEGYISLCGTKEAATCCRGGMVSMQIIAAIDTLLLLVFCMPLIVRSDRLFITICNVLGLTCASLISAQYFANYDSDGKIKHDGNPDLLDDYTSQLMTLTQVSFYCAMAGGFFGGVNELVGGIWEIWMVTKMRWHRDKEEQHKKDFKELLLEDRRKGENDEDDSSDEEKGNKKKKKSGATKKNKNLGNRSKSFNSFDVDDELEEMILKSTLLSVSPTRRRSSAASPTPIKQKEVEKSNPATSRRQSSTGLAEQHQGRRTSTETRSKSATDNNNNNNANSSRHLSRRNSDMNLIQKNNNYDSPSKSRRGSSSAVRMNDDEHDERNNNKNRSSRSGSAIGVTTQRSSSNHNKDNTIKESKSRKKRGHSSELGTSSPSSAQALKRRIFTRIDPQII